MGTQRPPGYCIRHRACLYAYVMMQDLTPRVIRFLRKMDKPKGVENQGIDHGPEQHEKNKNAPYPNLNYELPLGPLRANKALYESGTVLVDAAEGYNQNEIYDDANKDDLDACIQVSVPTANS